MIGSNSKQITLTGLDNAHFKRTFSLSFHCFDSDGGMYLILVLASSGSEVNSFTIQGEIYCHKILA